MEKKLQQLKIMLGIDGTDEDELLTLLLTKAGEKIVGTVYQYQDTSNIEVPYRYSFLQLEVAERMYNLRGAEGEKEHIENGVHRTYESIEDFIRNNVVVFCGVPTVKTDAQP